MLFYILRGNYLLLVLIKFIQDRHAISIMDFSLIILIQTQEFYFINTVDANQGNGTLHAVPAKYAAIFTNENNNFIYHYNHRLILIREGWILLYEDILDKVLRMLKFPWRYQRKL